MTTKIPFNIVGLDFETYYDDEYSLRKMTTTEYVRDPRFKTQCVSIQTARQKTPRNYHGEKLKTALHKIDWTKTALLAHHTQFDGFILSQHYDIIPAFYLDTLSMARPMHGGGISNSLNELARHYNLKNKLPDVLSQTKGIRELSHDLQKALGVYNNRDVEILWAIFRKMVTHYPYNELRLIDKTVRAYCDPRLVVDFDIAKKEHEKEKRKRQRVVRSTGLTAKELRSRKTFPQALREAGGEPPLIPDGKGGTKVTFAKDNLDFQRLFEHPSKEVRALVQAKSIVSSSIGETRAARLISHGNPNLPIYLNYGKAHTLRWTGGDKMNPQNFPRNSALRTAMRAPRGHKLVVIDSTSIELHVAAWLAGQLDLLEACRDPQRDPYCEFSTGIYGKEITKKKHPKERFVGKVGLLSLQYQTGASKLRHTLESGAMGMKVVLGETITPYQRIVNNYRSKYKQIYAAWAKMDYIISQMRLGFSGEYGPVEYDGKFIFMPNDLYLMYPRLRTRRDEDTEYLETIYNKNNKIYPGLLFNNIVQCLARIVVSDQILTVPDLYPTVLLVHDELVLCVPTRQAKKAFELAMEAFHTPPKWAPDLPVAGEGAIVDYYQKI